MTRFGMTKKILKIRLNRTFLNFVIGVGCGKEKERQYSKKLMIRRKKLKEVITL